MNAAAAGARRLRQFEAMGIVAYRLRTRGTVPTAVTPSATDEAVAAAPLPRVVVVCATPADAAARTIALALGLPEAALDWQVPQQGRLPALDQGAAAFLVLGNALARVLGAELPTTAQQTATIVVTSAPAQWRGDAMAKRLLWQALRPLRRQLREQPWSPS